MVDSRAVKEGAGVRRRRECLSCQKRFTTYETVESLPIVVVKKDNSRHTYYHHYTGKKWGKLENYDLALSTDGLSIKEAAEYIASLAKIK